MEAVQIPCEYGSKVFEVALLKECCSCVYYNEGYCSILKTRMRATAWCKYYTSQEELNERYGFTFNMWTEGQQNEEED